jgi:hypothetical protein
MGEFQSNMRYAKAVGASMKKPKIDTRHTSQRVTDEMNKLRNALFRAHNIIQSFINKSESYGFLIEDAELVLKRDKHLQDKENPDGCFKD